MGRRGRCAAGMPVVEMTLVDWTRMGRVYCLAGAVAERGGWRFVRPLLARDRNCPVRNTGWPPYLVDRHTRWEVFELIGVEIAPPQQPHLEDVWVRAMRPRRRTAPVAERRAILEAGARRGGEPLFGVRLSPTRAAAYLAPGTGERSLTTFVVPGAAVSFHVSERLGAPEPDYRATLAVPGLEGRSLSLKDHFLLRRAEAAGGDPEARCRALTAAVQGMGDRLAVRLGLSRAFAPSYGAPAANGRCWLMVDGIFSLTDPQP